MTDIEPDEEQAPPIAGVRIVYTGPVAPHWEIEGLYGEDDVIADFRRRTMARLNLLPAHDPQFRRNRERVIRDTERANIELEWDLGVPEDA